MQCLFGIFALERDYYYHPGKQLGHYPADAALGLEGAYTPALARLICLEGADQSSYQQAEEHLNEMERVAIRDYPPRTMRTDFPITRRTTI